MGTETDSDTLEDRLRYIRRQIQKNGKTDADVSGKTDTDIIIEKTDADMIRRKVGR